MLESLRARESFLTVVLEKDVQKCWLGNIAPPSGVPPYANAAGASTETGLAIPPRYHRDTKTQIYRPFKRDNAEKNQII